MFRSSLKYALAFTLLLPSIAAAEETSPVQETPTRPDVEGEIRAVPTLVWVDPAEDLVPEAAAAAEISKILFINRCTGGCTINPGLNDARSNSSSIASGTRLLSEFQWSDEIWNETIDCIRDVYAPYDVEVVTEDPGTERFHHEAILAGSASELGLGAGIGGIAPADCAPLNNVMSFSFANQDGNPINMCWTVAQESAHSYGLPNHAFNCLDPMTYIPGCGKKYFRNQNYPCGEFSQEASCRCSGSTQNSHRELLNVFGKGTAVIPGPAVNIALPAMDDTVMGRFPIFWNASDERLISHSEVWVNGSKVATVEGNDYATQQNNINYDIQAPENLADGYLDIEVKAYSDIGVESVAAVTVLKGAPCANADSCHEFQSCENGRCSFPPATKELGDSCDVVQECVEGVCADFGDSKSCTVTCNPNVTGGCAMDFECVSAVSGDFVCQEPAEIGGCCSVAGTKRDPLPWLGAGLFLLGLMILRRKRVR